MDLQKIINEAINDEFKAKGINLKEEKEVLNEGYAVQVNNYNLKTELLSEKNKKEHLGLLEGYTKNLNRVASELEGVDKSEVNPNHSLFRSLKKDEAYNHNAVFLHSLFFENISDLNSKITTDSLSYMKLSKDFGSFEEWQEDFIACALSSRNGWVVTGYNIYLQRYMNTVIDLHSQDLVLGMIPVIVLDCWEHSYYRDYLTNRKKYVHGMMKELKWETIEERFEKCELIQKVMRK
jgi:Fe-Mn family superoxide dismutase